MYDVAIIGAGVVGAMVARALAKWDIRICILEKEHDVAMGATKANSAIVHAGFDAAEGSLKALLNVQGSQMMRDVCEELGVKYQNNGSLVLAFNEEERQTVQALQTRGENNGVIGLRVVEKDELLQMEPHVSEEVVCALYAPSGAIVCPYELAVAAIGHAMDNGADLRCDFAVERIEATEDRYRLYAKDACVEARFVVNCAGVYADAIAAMIGDNTVSIRPRRGEYMLLDKVCGDLVKHTIFRTPSAMGKGILISPTVDGNLLLGPTSEDIDEKENKDTTAQGFARIVQGVCESVPCVPLRNVITSFCGLRAVGNTGDFILCSPRERFVNAAGIESPGLSASPAIALYIAELLQQQGLSTREKDSYIPTRRSMHWFREASLEEKNAAIRNDPSFGKIVCRCEGVTEGEILEAIRRHPRPRDLDGVKRRTRAQMGRCQGGFCGPYIAELLAKELNLPTEQVTKSGGRSHIAVGRTKGGKEQ